MSGPSKGSFTRSERLAIFVNVVLICLLGAGVAVGVVALAVELSYRAPLRADLTSSGRFSLDPGAASIIDAVAEPVRVTLVVGMDADRRARVSDLSGAPRMDLYAQHYLPLLLEYKVRAGTVLEAWGRRNEKIRVDVIEKDTDLGRLKAAAEFHGKSGDDLVNKVTLRCGSRERVVPLDWLARAEWGFFPPDPRRPAVFPEIIGPWQIQSVLSAALRSVADGETTRIAVPRGAKGALEPDAPEFAPVARFLRGNGYEPVSFALKDGVPTDCGILLMPAVAGRLDAGASEKLREFEARSGRVLLLADWSRPENYVSVLEPYGVKMPAVVVEDPPNKRAGQPDTFLLESSRMSVGLHPIDAGLKDRTTMFLGTVRPLLVDEKVRGQGVQRIPLLRGSNDAKSAPVDHGAADGKTTFDLAARTATPAPLYAAALSRPGIGGKECRVVVVGTPELLQPELLTVGGNWGNRDFVLNTLNWLSERSIALSGVSDRDLLGSRIEITDRVLDVFTVFAAIGIPLALAACGFIIAARRRR